MKFSQSVFWLLNLVQYLLALPNFYIPNVEWKPAEYFAMQKARQASM